MAKFYYTKNTSDYRAVSKTFTPQERDKHIENFAEKVNSGIGAMRRIRDFVKRDT